MTRQLLIFGSHARPAAFSALRAGLQPWCADLFADQDLQARCPVVRVPRKTYPACLIDLAGVDSTSPWMYTGALENHPQLIADLARQRPLWGNTPEALQIARSPFQWTRLLAEAGIACPAVRELLPAPPADRRWLGKPLAGRGGCGVGWWRKPVPGLPVEHYYLQEYIEGLPCSAVYLGTSSGARLLGASRQLIGEKWANAQAFRYCGSVGPMPVKGFLGQTLERIGSVLTSGCGLRGLWGLDFVLRDGLPWPVEINPRFSSSIEVLEYATGLPALALHRRVFDPTAAEPGWSGAPAVCPIVGKVIYFAPEPVIIPAANPWDEVLRQPGDIHEMPAYADLPSPGTRIEAGHPILTIFGRGNSPTECLGQMRERLREVQKALLKPDC